MEDESSSKAVTLLPHSHAAAQPNTTPPPPSLLPAAGGTAATPGDCATPNAGFHIAPTTPEFSPQARPQPPTMALTHATAATTSEAGRESESNEEPLFQHPPPLPTTSPTSQGQGLWSGVSATPPSAYLGAGANYGGGVGGLFPSSALTTSEFVGTPAGQSLAVGRDLSNRHPAAPSIKQHAAAGAVGRSAMPATYLDSSNSESISNTISRTAGPTSNGGYGGSGHAHRSLFRSVAPASGALPASPLMGPSQWSQRLRGDDSGGVAPVTPMTPALAGDTVLVMEPPTPAKQRRTIHTGATSGYGEAAGNGVGLRFGPRLSTTMSAASTNAFASLNASTARSATAAAAGAATGGSSGGGGAASPPTLHSRAVAPLRIPLPSAVTTATTSPSLPYPTTPVPNTTNNNTNSGGGATAAAPSFTFKFHKREGSRKRSAEVLSQFSALDLDETPATPYGQTVMNGRFSSLGGYATFPSQPSAAKAPQRNNAAMGPTSPLMAGYATPVTLSQQIGGSNTFSQMLLQPSQDILDMSQADTECSNFLARRIVNDYNEVRLLGRGSFGTVSLYKEISSGEYVAVKMSPPLRAPDMERRYRRERSIMGLVRGMPHVVQLSAAWEEGRVPRMYLQLEYCPGGSLASLASAKQARNEPWEEDEVKVFLAHMCIALDAMHRARIAHVDFKPDNVLIDKDGAYKLSDFGCSVLLDEKGRPRPETQNGYGTAASPSRVQPPPPMPQRGGGPNGTGYGSPTSKKETTGAMGNLVADFNWNEATETSTASVDEGDCRYLCADMLNEKRYFMAGDMFSLGMSLYELISGQPLPRNGDQFLALRRQVPAEMLLNRGYSRELVRLVAALLHSDPTQRPTARQVLQFLRPSAAEMRLLADPAAMQQWTASAESFSAMRAEQLQQHESSKGNINGTGNGGESAGLRATTTALRCVSALAEGSCWLLTTTQQDVQRALAAAEAEGGDEEEAQQQQQQQQQPRARRCPPFIAQRDRRCDALESGTEEYPMSPIMREEACTPTTLNY